MVRNKGKERNTRRWRTDDSVSVKVFTFERSIKLHFYQFEAIETANQRVERKRESEGRYCLIQNIMFQQRERKREKESYISIFLDASSFSMADLRPPSFSCLFIRCVRFCGIKWGVPRRSDSSRPEWISPDYLVAPNRSESGTIAACIVRHMPPSSPRLSGRTIAGTPSPSSRFSCSRPPATG